MECLTRVKLVFNTRAADVVRHMEVVLYGTVGPTVWHSMPILFAALQCSSMMLLLETDGSSPYVITNHVMDGRNCLTGIDCTPFSHIYIHKLWVYFNLIECNDRKTCSPCVHYSILLVFNDNLRKNQPTKGWAFSLK